MLNYQKPPAVYAIDWEMEMEVIAAPFIQLEKEVARQLTRQLKNNQYTYTASIVENKNEGPQCITIIDQYQFIRLGFAPFTPAVDSEKNRIE